MAGKKTTKQKPWRLAYKAENRLVKNKQKKIARHKLKHPNDKQEIGLIPDYKLKKR